MCAAVALAGWIVPGMPAIGMGAQSPPSRAADVRTGAFDELAARAAAARDGGRGEDALAFYRAAVAKRPGWAEGHWYIASLLYEADRYAEARDGFSAVLKNEPSHAGAMGMRGLCEFQLRDYERSLSDLLQSRTMGISRSPAIDRVVRFHASLLLTRFGEFEVAYQMLTTFAEEGGDTPEVIEAFGVNLLRLPVLPSEASAELREAILVGGRAGYAMAARQPRAARAALDDLVTRYPKLPHAHYFRGVFFLTENADLALEDFRREIEISPSHVPARLQIAYEFLKRGNAAQARRPAEEAVALAPEQFAAHLALGQVLLDTNDVAGAVRELEAAVARAPGSPQTYFMLARAYARAGRTAEAERARAEFTRLDQSVRGARQGAQAVGGIPAANADRRPQP